MKMSIAMDVLFTNKSVKRFESFVSEDLNCADFTGADLKNTDFYWSNLRYAHLIKANLVGANFDRANLHCVNASGANFTNANLINANLRNANLTQANFTNANLMGANLTGARLLDANLTGAKLSPFSIVPEKGSFIGFKKLAEGYIAVLEIPNESKRMSCISSRDCRAEFAKVLDIIDVHKKTIKIGHSWYSPIFQYKVGEMVYPSQYDPDTRINFSKGIHFFMTYEEAELFLF